MLGIERKAARYTWTTVLILLLVACVYLARQAIIVFAVALLLTYLLYPLFTVLNRILPGRSRGPALALVYIILFGIATLMVLTVGSQVADEASALATQLPELLKRFQSQADQSAVPQHVRTLQDQVIDQVRAQLTQHTGELMSLVPRYSLELLSGSRYLLLAIVVPIISFFMLKDGNLIREEVIELFSAGRNRDLVEDVLSDIHLLLLQYMRALFTLCLAVFGSFALVFSLLGVPDSLLLATIAFPMEFVPLVGPLAAAVIIMVVVVFSGYAHPFWVLTFLGIYRLFQDYVLSPNLMAAGVELHPLLVIFGVFAGGELGGEAGIFLSVPVLAMARIVLVRVRKQRVIEPHHVDVA
jgi:predicted PurR-regulated permease PerM